MTTETQFTGTQPHQLDAKNRFRIPAKFKVDLDKLWLCKGIGKNRCIFILPEDTYNNLLNSINSTIDFFDEEAQEAYSFFFHNIEKVEADQQGRITLPKSFRDYANINQTNKNIVTCGSGTRLELWSEEELQRRDQSFSIHEAVAVLHDRAKKAKEQ